MKVAVAVVCYVIAALIAFAFVMWLRQMYLVGGSVRQAFSMAVSLGWDSMKYVTICVLGVIGFAWLGVHLGARD